MQETFPIRKQNPSEDGYMLLAAVFLMFLLALSLSIAAPMIAKSIQRDREVETMERGKQYSRAVQLYFKKFNAYPPSIDALVKTNNTRFLRKRYIDPMTGKDDWKPIMFGQNKAPLAMGFFGEPLAGGATALAGTGPSGGNGASSGTGFGTGTGGFGTPSSGPTGTTSIFGSSQGNGTGAGTASTGILGSTSTSGTAAVPGQSGTAVTTMAAGSNTSTFGGQQGQTFGGAGIVGFEPASPQQSILSYKKKNHYNEWEFTYSPISDQMKQMGGNGGAIGRPAGGSTGQPGMPGFGSSPGFGTNPGSGTNLGTGATNPGGNSGTTTPRPQ